MVMLPRMDAKLLEYIKTIHCITFFFGLFNFGLREKKQISMLYLIEKDIENSILCVSTNEVIPTDFSLFGNLTSTCSFGISTSTFNNP